MRRDQSHTYREQLIQICSGSKEVNHISKTKKSKLHQIARDQRKVDKDALRNIEVNEVRTKNSQTTLKQRAVARLLDKVKMIRKFTQRFMDKKTKEILYQLVALVQKEQNIRSQLDNLDIERSRIQIQELRESVKRLKDRQQEVMNLSYSTPISAQSTKIGSTVYLKDLIGMEMSPTSKLGSFGFIQKRNQVDLKCKGLTQELQNKNEVIRRLFDKIQKMGSLDQKQRTFHQIYQLYQKKLDDYQFFSTKVNELKSTLEEQSERISKYAKENENIKTEYTLMEQERDYQKSQYDKLYEEFQVQYGEKLSLEKKLTKKTKELDVSNQNRIKIENNRLQLEEIVKDELWNLKAMQQHERDKLRELQILCQDVKAVIKSCNKKCLDIIAERGQEHEAEIMTLKKLNREVENHRLRLLGQKQVQKMEIEGYKAKQVTKIENLHLFSNINQHIFISNTKSRNTSFTIESLDIFKTQQNDHKPRLLTSDIQIQQKQQKQQTVYLTQERSTQTYHPQQEDSNNQTDTIQQIQMMLQTDRIQIFQVILQTEISEGFHEQMQTEQVQVITQGTTTSEYTLMEGGVQTDQPEMCYQYIQTGIVALQLQSSVYQESVQANMALQLVQVQEDEVQTEVQKDEPTQQYDLQQDENGCQEPQQQQMDDHQILLMLKDAEQCLLIPEIQHLKRQILTYRQEIEHLNFKIKQQQKDREEEAVFNFRL